jgi:hypothetical protein
MLSIITFDSKSKKILVPNQYGLAQPRATVPQL